MESVSPTASAGLTPAASGSTPGALVLLLEIGNDVLADQRHAARDLFAVEAAHPRPTQQLSTPEAFLQRGNLFDTGVGIAADHRACAHELIPIDRGADAA